MNGFLSNFLEVSGVVRGTIFRFWKLSEERRPPPVFKGRIKVDSYISVQYQWRVRSVCQCQWKKYCYFELGCRIHTSGAVPCSVFQCQLRLPAVSLNIVSTDIFWFLTDVGGVLCVFQENEWRTTYRIGAKSSCSVCRYVGMYVGM